MPPGPAPGIAADLGCLGSSWDYRWRATWPGQFAQRAARPPRRRDLAAQLRAAKPKSARPELTREAKARVDSAASQRRLAQSTLKLRPKPWVQELRHHLLARPRQKHLRAPRGPWAAAQTQVKTVAAVNRLGKRINLRGTLPEPLGRVCHLAETETRYRQQQVLTLLDIDDMYTDHLPYGKSTAR